MSRHDEIRASYKTLGNAGIFYDGMITPLFEIKKSLESRLEGVYSRSEVHFVNTEGVFCCVK